MSAVIVIEIVIGIVVLAAAVRFAVRDTMQREANRDVESADTSPAPAHSSEHCDCDGGCTAAERGRLTGEELTGWAVAPACLALPFPNSTGESPPAG